MHIGKPYRIANNAIGGVAATGLKYLHRFSTDWNSMLIYAN
ncbi:MAG TPA: hypothetical protein VGO68_16240 [Pyrinomonadaceae bacterium]|nr:hypothetical protein [Pyrinomonadaceae bacterium]